MRLGTAAQEALVAKGLFAFPHGPERYRWRLRIAVNVWDEAEGVAVEHGGLRGIHDPDTRVFGYFAVRDPELPDGEVVLETFEDRPRQDAPA